MASVTGDSPTSVTQDPPAFGTWRKSTRSDSGGNCVQAAKAADGRIGVRDSKDPAGPVLMFTRDEWNAFVEGVHLGEFDTTTF
jgi:hypothetical protein